MTFGEVSAQVATFTNRQYPVLGNTHIAADFNGDGTPDLAGAGANAVSVMLGNGDGTFRAKSDFPIGVQTQAVAAGDFNSDGKVDLVVTLNSPQLNLALLTGTGASRRTTARSTSPGRPRASVPGSKTRSFFTCLRLARNCSTRSLGAEPVSRKGRAWA